MKRFSFFIVLMFLFSAGTVTQARAQSDNRLGVSIVVSGHLFFGLKFEHSFDTHQAVQFTFYPVCLPARGMPLAATAGYNYYFGKNNWQGKVGAEFALLASPRQNGKRKFLPMLNFTPGIRYQKNPDKAFGGSIWISYLLKNANRKIAPTGLEFWYGWSL